ncbi:MAG: PKD domain-containing protein, partial [Bacteroidetes bacterium]|nr:PKD domain-containing protein [Bacteroidota bacterium]MBU1718348.1 PKD domain-containing protein [Bacteroidota bacterium]
MNHVVKKSFAVFCAVFFVLQTARVSAQVIDAEFTANQTSGCGFLLVNFTDLSTGNPTSWHWDFGDGTTSIIRNPAHPYNTPGNYTVSLIATNATNSNTETKIAYIRIFAKPVCGFSADDVSGCSPLPVQFTDASYSPAGVIDSWSWDFGDGNTSAIQNPSNTYLAGTYNVSLTVSDTNNCSTNYVITQYISVDAAPVSNFVSSQAEACSAPVTVDFTNLSAGTGLSYLWDFGDGITSGVMNPSHIYNSEGAFSVSLVATSPNGCSDTAVQQGFVQINTYAPVISASITEGCAPLTVVFNDSTWQTTVFQWDFGDGNFSTLGTPANVYSTDGIYSINLIAQNHIGCTDTIAANNLILVHPRPVIDFSIDDSSSCLLPFDVTFTDLSSGVVSWKWYFGDATTSTLQNPTHSYTSEGAFSVTLAGENSFGCRDSLTKLNLISITEPVAAFDPSGERGCIPRNVSFTDTSNTPGTIVSWTWDYGDGTVISGSDPTPNHIYTDTGMYSVTLIIETDEGCRDTITRNNIVQAGMKPDIYFYADDTVGCHPFSVQFHDTSSYFAQYHRWYFGDGQNEISIDPMHEYTDTGYFDVKLIVGHYGCIDSLELTDYIQVLTPKADFAADSAYHCLFPHTVNFADSSDGGNIWFWDFGDGNTSALQNPANDYLLPGFYDVKLVVTDTITGCIDSLTQAAFVRISDIFPGFVMDTAEICLGDTITFTDTSMTFAAVTSYIWYFGDGNCDSVITPDVPHVYSAPGLFSVKLLVTDAIGCMDSITNNNVAAVHSLPTVFATVDPLTGCKPLVVSYEDHSVAADSATITNWSWNFGDATPISNLESGTHTFLNRGSFVTSLIVGNSFGCFQTLSPVATIVPTFPYPSFTFDTLVCQGDTVAFTNTSTGSGMTYQWDYGDGITSSDTQTVHAYNPDTTTSYTVTLTVTDVNGCDSSISHVIHVSKPVADFYAVETVSECPPFFCQFNSNGSSTDVVAWAWNLGDPSSGAGNNSVVANPQHMYIDPGLYDIELIVTNTIGCSDTLTRVAYIAVNGPSSTFLFSPANGCAPLTVTFVAQNASNVATYMWLPGDGSVIYGDSVEYTYSNGGSFLPYLIIEDSLSGPLDSVVCSVPIAATSAITVIEATPGFLPDTVFLCLPGNIFFTDTSTASMAIDMWEWTFGDGTPADTNRNPVHHFGTPGVYDVTLTIGIDSCRYSVVENGLIEIYDPPQVDFLANKTSDCEPLF